MTHVPAKVRELLDASGLPWSLERGGRHWKIMVCGRLAGILPMSKPHSRLNSRCEKNMIANIRRRIRGESK